MKTIDAYITEKLHLRKGIARKVIEIERKNIDSYARELAEEIGESDIIKKLKEQAIKRGDEYFNDRMIYVELVEHNLLQNALRDSNATHKPNAVIKYDKPFFHNWLGWTNWKDDWKVGTKYKVKQPHYTVVYKIEPVTLI